MTRNTGKRLLIVLAIFTLLAFASQTPVGAATAASWAQCPPAPPDADLPLALGLFALGLTTLAYLEYGLRQR